MIINRAKFTIEYEVDLDSVPGWGHDVEDWIKLATSDVLRQTHYFTTSKVISTETSRFDTSTREA